MVKKIELEGRRFGKLLVLYESEERKDGHVLWHCICDCGREVNVRSNSLLGGTTQSCRCINNKKTKEEKRKYHREYYANHREKKKEQQRIYRSSHREEILIKDRERYKNNRNYLKNYGITIDEYNSLLSEQNYECKICHKHIDNSKHAFAVDHEHKTGIVRGLLCRQCNAALGLFKEDIDIILNAIIYLRGEL